MWLLWNKCNLPRIVSLVNILNSLCDKLIISSSVYSYYFWKWTSYFFVIKFHEKSSAHDAQCHNIVKSWDTSGSNMQWISIANKRSNRCHTPSRTLEIIVNKTKKDESRWYKQIESSRFSKPTTRESRQGYLDLTKSVNKNRCTVQTRSMAGS